jgi:hypothetical protein
MRSEVLEVRGPRHISTVVLPCPKSGKRAAAAATLATLGPVLGCWEYTRAIHIAGTVAPCADATRMVAPLFGWIVS